MFKVEELGSWEFDKTIDTPRAWSIYDKTKAVVGPQNEEIAGAYNRDIDKGYKTT